MTMIEKVARAICYERAGPACSCKAKGTDCLALAENLLHESNERGYQARAALAALQPNR